MRSFLRVFLPLIAVLALVAGLAAVKAKQIGMLIKAGKAAEAAGPPPEVVNTGLAKQDTWALTLTAVGSVEAVKGVTLSNDAPGIITAIRFESGAEVKAGEVLVELDSSVERAQLGSVLARRELAKTSLERNKALVDKGALPAAQLDGDEATLKSANADAAALQAQIARKTVRAPFAGKLGIRAVNLGQYLNPGTPITMLESKDALYVDFTLPQQKLGQLALGTKVEFHAVGVEGTLAGAIAAIDTNVDPVSRSVRIRATVEDKAQKLRPGMFLDVLVILDKQQQVVAVPATAIVHATYGNSVFVVEDKGTGADGKPLKVARQQFVRTGAARGDFVSIEDGLKAGETVVVAGAFKLRNGASIVVNDTVKFDPQLAPKPENH
ncbi:MAG: efflux RND transporter periplasmic adaptor subunit [Myxococcales bacterium]|nr:efflux RND transporter periplasmic adaptor subunit [Myxococcales bacterium]